MKRGTIVLTHFPFTDLTSSKRRPAVVISKVSDRKMDVIVAFNSSVVPDVLSDTDLLFDVSRNDFSDSGLKKKSVFKLDKIATLNKAIFSGEMGCVESETLKLIEEKLKIALDLN